MKYTSRILVPVGVTVAAVFMSTTLFAQGWTASEKEVWKTIEDIDTVWAKRDAESFLSYFHPDFTIWGPEDAVPRDKDNLAKWVRFHFKRDEVLVHEVRPALIRVFGNVAIAYYYWRSRIKEPDGKERVWNGRWTATLLKEKDRWLMIAVHEGPYTVSE